MILRRPVPPDAAAMADLLNAIIAIGGTTAHQHPTTPEEMRHYNIDGPALKTSIVAVDHDRMVGFQTVGFWQGEDHIGTFVQPGLQAKGLGAAMFTETCTQARAAGLTCLIAAIRADNVPGLAYYARIGFRDIATIPDFALDDGRIVGRVIRRFDL